jgi:hypothetical protein
MRTDQQLFIRTAMRRFHHRQEVSPNRPAVKSGDIHVERYLGFLIRESRRLFGSRIAAHHILDAATAYTRFLRSGQPADRYDAWKSIASTCGWLSQLEGRSS